MQQISFIFSSKFKHACSILLLIIMIFLGIVFLQKATMRDSSGFKYRPFLQEDTEYDVLFFGTSHVINGIFPCSSGMTMELHHTTLEDMEIHLLWRTGPW